jgi:transcriptional regulator with XRE-family HTH domain
MNRGHYKIEDEEADADALFRNTAALRELLERAITRVGGPAELARRLEVTPSHVSRLRQGLWRLSVKVLLRLAELLDEDGVEVVRVCGHTRMADRLDVLRRGSPHRPRSKLYDAVDRLSEDDREMVSGFVRRLLFDSQSPAPLPAADPQTRSWR